MTANPLVAARCGRRDAVAKLIGDAGPHREAVANGWANHAQLLADDGLASAGNPTLDNPPVNELDRP